MTQDYIEIKMTIPSELFVIINEVARHGVFHMLIPPVDTIKRWIDKDDDVMACETPKRKTFQSENEEQAFLSYMDSLIPPSLLDTLDKEEEAKDNNEEESKLVAQPAEMEGCIMDNDETFKQLEMAVQAFSQNVQDKTVQYLLPLYVDIRDEFVSKGCVPEALSKETKDALSDVLFDLLVSLKKDLESDAVRSVLAELNAGDAEFEGWHRLLEDMMKRHNYESHAVLDARDKLSTIIFDTLKPVLLSINNALDDGITKTFKNLLEEDRKRIPQPGFLE